MKKGQKTRRTNTRKAIEKKKSKNNNGKPTTLEKRIQPERTPYLVRAELIHKERRIISLVESVPTKAMKIDTESAKERKKRYIEGQIFQMSTW